MDHKELNAWKESIVLVKEVYRYSDLLPEGEKYGLISQIRRCAISIPANIAEGAARQSDKELIQFLHIFLGSLAELETLVVIINELSLIEFNTKLINEKIENIRKMIIGLIKHLKKK